MHLDGQTPEVPEKGFYYHYKHDNKGIFNNYAYEVIGAGLHTEDDCRVEDEYMVVYRPLYSEAFVYKNGKMFDVRPLAMFMENVVTEGKDVKRFTKITDPDLITKLEALRDQMYP